MTVPPGIIGIQALRGLPEPRDQRAVLAILREMRGELAAAMGIFLQLLRDTSAQ